MLSDASDEESDEEYVKAEAELPRERCEATLASESELSMSRSKECFFGVVGLGYPNVGIVLWQIPPTRYAGLG